MALKDITLGQFFPGNSLAHRLDPRTKLICVVLYIVALFLASWFATYAVMFLVLANIGIFTPAGFFPALLWRRWRWWKSLLAGLAASVSIELLQLFVDRSTDIDDVILNTAGALAGFWVFCLLRLTAPGLTQKFQCQPRGGN